MRSGRDGRRGDSRFRLRWNCARYRSGENKVGIYSRPVKLTDSGADGDRAEIYRPQSPIQKALRRQRAENRLADTQPLPITVSAVPHPGSTGAPGVDNRAAIRQIRTKWWGDCRPDERNLIRRYHKITFVNAGLLSILVNTPLLLKVSVRVCCKYVSCPAAGGRHKTKVRTKRIGHHRHLTIPTRTFGDYP